MATRIVVPALALLTLLAGCGSGDDADAKQAALLPAGAEIEESAPAPAPSDSTAPAPASGPATPATTAESVPAADADAMPSLSRESFSYTGGSRDPFASALDLSLVGPELPDLQLVAIYYDTRRPVRSVVVMREKVSGKRHNLRPGDRIGRIRVSSIRPKDVTFSIDDFGTTREETLTLRKQEDTP